MSRFLSCLVYYFLLSVYVIRLSLLVVSHFASIKCVRLLFVLLLCPSLSAPVGSCMYAAISLSISDKYYVTMARMKLTGKRKPHRTLHLDSLRNATRKVQTPGWDCICQTNANMIGHGTCHFCQMHRDPTLYEIETIDITSGITKNK